MEKSSSALGWVIGVAVLAATVFVVGYAFKKGTKAA
jgi:hypothetical protein